MRLSGGSSDAVHGRCCQTKIKQTQTTATPPTLGRKQAPLGKGSGAVEFEFFAAVEVTLPVEVIAD